jgi:hypothetical protein
MNKSIVDIVRDVRTTIDEIALNDSDFFGGLDNYELHEIVRQKLAEAVDFVHGNTNTSLVDFKDSAVKSRSLDKSSEDTEDKTKYGTISESYEYRIRVPEDYHRFVEGVMDCWSEYVTETIDAGDPDYRKVQDQYSGASVLRPAILWDGRQFRFLRGSSEDNKATLIYFPRCEYDANENPNDEVEINRPLYTALIYHLSGLVLLTYGEQRADDMFNMAMTHMGVTAKA